MSGTITNYIKKPKQIVKHFSSRNLEMCPVQIIQTEKSICGNQAAVKEQAPIKSAQDYWRFVWAPVPSWAPKMTLVWISGHEGDKRNEVAVALACVGASIAMIGWNSFCGVVKRITEKEFSKGLSPKFTKDLLHHSRKFVRAVVDLLTGHCRFRKRLSILNLVEETVSSARKKRKPSAKH